MSFLLKTRREDLLVLVKERFGITIPENATGAKIRALITGSSNYDEQRTKEVLSGIKEEREREREVRERKQERERKERERQHEVRMKELQKLIDDRKRGTRKLTEDRESEKQKLKEDRGRRKQQKLKEDRERVDKMKRTKEQERELREGIERLTEILMRDQDEESKTQDFKPFLNLNESVGCLGAAESAERPEFRKFDSGFEGKEVNVKGVVRRFPEWSGPNVNRKRHLRRGCPKINRFRLDQKKDQAKQDSVERVGYEKRVKKDESNLRRIEVVEEKSCFSKIIYSVPKLSGNKGIEANDSDPDCENSDRREVRISPGGLEVLERKSSGGEDKDPPCILMNPERGEKVGGQDKKSPFSQDQRLKKEQVQGLEFEGMLEEVREDFKGREVCGQRGFKVKVKSPINALKRVDLSCEKRNGEAKARLNLNFRGLRGV
ncbi:uncharacterized protein [Parasteatoda tepidariorum]|uniref:uncharacterized protein n=1 Tax=Parasteatoda tepidariorum TaxID=114398 RepID=UPI0039BD7796